MALYNFWYLIGTIFVVGLYAAARFKINKWLYWIFQPGKR